ncbi:unnamed protein product [Strongylus vulgaris]|uniref:TM2 domain-containing protein n=1 Tax=Strongylus vulgaris TaxID=40348 RepID=A0A3P7IKM9_STRVU|nr:unnamed protein product [Strongylus vulgaris]
MIDQRVNVVPAFLTEFLLYSRVSVCFKHILCFRYTGHHFLSTLLYSIFLGVVAVDRFCLGYSAIAVGKLMTLGGLGVWWIIDIFLLVTGNLTPADDSNWEPYY